MPQLQGKGRALGTGSHLQLLLLVWDSITSTSSSESRAEGIQRQPCQDQKASQQVPVPTEHTSERLCQRDPATPPLLGLLACVHPHRAVWMPE